MEIIYTNFMTKINLIEWILGRYSRIMTQQSEQR